MKKEFSILDKSRAVNVEPFIYGSFAEIGAGQEVARNYFIAGGASNTVAKTMSAYDMVFSDSIYGAEKSGRYVCQSRLVKMLDKEFNLLQKRLSKIRDKRTKYFAFANTVAAKTLNKPKGRGWVGIRFQPKANSEPHDIHLHVRMLDPRNTLQQEALGYVGVNLIYAAFFLRKNPEVFVRSLMENLNNKRIHIDMIYASGKELSHFDSREINLLLAKNKMTEAVAFDENGNPLEPGELFYGNNLLILRGQYRPLSNIHCDIFKCAQKHYAEEKNNKAPMLCIAEFASQTGEHKIKDYSDRIELLAAKKIPTLVTSFCDYYRLHNYLREFTDADVRILTGSNNLPEVFSPKRYQHLTGGLLEALGELFKGNCKMLVYPMKKKSKLVNSQNFHPPKKFLNLYKHFLENNFIEDMDCYNPDFLEIDTHTLVKKIKSKDKSWKKEVPKEVADIITKKKLFR